MKKIFLLSLIILISLTGYSQRINNNIELTSLTTKKFCVVPSNINVQGTITNIGDNTIHTIHISWSDGINSYNDEIKGLNIIPDQTYSFVHKTKLSVLRTGEQNVVVKVEKVNNSLDLEMNNNILEINIHGMVSSPVKRVVFEEATGTWCGWCPRGTVALEELAVNYPNTAIGINDI